MQHNRSPTENRTRKITACYATGQKHLWVFGEWESIAWVTKSSTDGLASFQLGALLINACIDETNREQCISINVLNGVQTNTTYDLSNDPIYGAKFNWSLSSGICFYEEENTLIGQLTIKKLDQTNLIVSGLFDFTTIVAGCDTIRVTDGRFDLTYAN